MTNGNAELGESLEPAGATGWTFLTNHAHVLLTIARDPQTTMRRVAAGVGITERATQKIVADLVAAGYLTKNVTAGATATSWPPVGPSAIP